MPDGVSTSRIEITNGRSQQHATDADVYGCDDCFRSLVVSLVHSRLDYGNFLLVGLPVYQQRHLASVLNAKNLD